MQLSFSHTLHPKSQRAAGKRWTRRNQHVQTSSGVPLLDVLRNSLNSVLKTHLGQQKWVLKQKTLTFRSQTLPAYLGPQPRNSDGHRKYMVRVTGLPSLNRLSRKWNLKWIHLSNSSLIFLRREIYFFQNLPEGSFVNAMKRLITLWAFWSRLLILLDSSSFTCPFEFKRQNPWGAFFITSFLLFCFRHCRKWSLVVSVKCP